MEHYDFGFIIVSQTPWLQRKAITSLGWRASLNHMEMRACYELRTRKTDAVELGSASGRKKKFYRWPIMNYVDARDAIWLECNRHLLKYHDERNTCLREMANGHCVYRRRHGFSVRLLTTNPCSETSSEICERGWIDDLVVKSLFLRSSTWVEW